MFGASYFVFFLLFFTKNKFNKLSLFNKMEIRICFYKCSYVYVCKCLRVSMAPCVFISFISSWYSIRYHISLHIGIQNCSPLIIWSVRCVVTVYVVVVVVDDEFYFLFFFCILNCFVAAVFMLLWHFEFIHMKFCVRHFTSRHTHIHIHTL